MIWHLLHQGAEIARGSREQMLDAAERSGVLYRVRPGPGGKPYSVGGRGFYDDGVEQPARLVAGWAILPVALRAAGRRAA